MLTTALEFGVVGVLFFGYVIWVVEALTRL